MTKSFSLVELGSKVGEEILVSDWVSIDQNKINLFAEATNDHQYIHVDEDKAKNSPFGGTIAHGFLTLAMLADAIPRPDKCKMVINYGTEKVRFLKPVKSGSRVRAQISLITLDNKESDRYLANFGITVEIEGEDKPALICELLKMFVM